MRSKIIQLADDPLSRLEELARSLQFRLGGMLFGCRFAMAAGAGTFLAGAVILGARLLVPAWSAAASLLTVAVAFAAAAATAFFQLYRRLPSRRKLLVYLDSLNRENSGLAIAALEIETGPWRQAVKVPELPKVRPASARFFIPAVVGAVFLGGSAFFPLPDRRGQEQRELNISDETAALTRKLQVLEEEKLIPEEEFAALKSELIDLNEKNDAYEAGRTYEILEALSRKLDSIGLEAGNRSLQNLETMEMLSLALSLLAARGTEPDSGGAKRELAELLRQLAAENPELAEMLKALFGEEWRELAAQLTPELLQQLAAGTKLSAEELEKLLEKLQDARLIKIRLVQAGEKCEDGAGGCLSPLDAASLAAWLANNAPGADELMRMVCRMPGFGGIDRGRGDADLNLSGNPADFEGESAMLKLNGRPSAENSVLIRKIDAAPEIGNGDRRAVAAGSLQGGEAKIEQRKVRIHPEHREAVRRYFNTEKQ